MSNKTGKDWLRFIFAFFPHFIFDSFTFHWVDGKVMATINDLNENPLFHIMVIIKISLSTVICIFVYQRCWQFYYPKKYSHQNKSRIISHEEGVSFDTLLPLLIYLIQHVPQMKTFCVVITITSITIGYIPLCEFSDFFVTILDRKISLKWKL